MISGKISRKRDIMRSVIRESGARNMEKNIKTRGRSRRGKQRKPWIAMILAAAVLIIGLVTAAAVIIGFGAEKEIRTEGEKDRQDEKPVFGGAELTMLKSQSKGQMMSFLLETKEGSLIVIDGGRWDDGDYLVEQIKKRGGHVSAWLLTHTHTDHVGALIKILQNEEDGEGAGIQIDNFYYCLLYTSMPLIML